MLKDEKAKAFTENFAGQWLGLREIDATLPDRQLYPEYDKLLRASMIKEVYLFFDEVLKNDLSLTNFVDSEFSFLNNRLAEHYGVPDVTGLEFRKVSLPKNLHRGGVMTMAAVLKVTANGTTTSPIVRGAWVLDSLLGTPPPRPPMGVEAVEPDIRGATTIREQLARHRQIEACATCHVLIDPPGFALENFDVIGGWRDHYRSIGNGERPCRCAESECVTSTAHGSMLRMSCRTVETVRQHRPVQAIDLGRQGSARPSVGGEVTDLRNRCCPHVLADRPGIESIVRSGWRPGLWIPLIWCMRSFKANSFGTSNPMQVSRRRMLRAAGVSLALPRWMSLAPNRRREVTQR